jgi:hypothetical protein
MVEVAVDGVIILPEMEDLVVVEVVDIVQIPQVFKEKEHNIWEEEQVQVLLAVIKVLDHKMVVQVSSSSDT